MVLLQTRISCILRKRGEEEQTANADEYSLDDKMRICTVRINGHGNGFLVLLRKQRQIWTSLLQGHSYKERPSGPLLAFKLISFTEIEASVLAGVPVIRHGPGPPIKNSSDTNLDPNSRTIQLWGTKSRARPKTVANRVVFWGKGGVRVSTLEERVIYQTKGDKRRSPE